MNTPWRAWAAGVYLSTGLLAFVIVLLGLLASEGLGFGLFFSISWAIAAACVLAGLALTDFPIADIASPPDTTLAYLGSRLRYSQTRVAEKAGELHVQLGGTAAARIRVRAEGTGARISFRMDLTPSGLGLVMLLLIFTGLGLFAIPVIVGVFLAARRFALQQVALLLPAVGPLSERPARDEVQDLLVNGLAEAHRIAADAYDAERSSYHDLQGVVFLGALLVWAAVLILSFTGSTDPDFGSRILTSMELALVGAFAFGLSAGFAVWRRFASRLRQLVSARESLRAAWLREVSRVPPELSGTSSFELLAESSKAVPDWLAVIERSGLSRDPALGIFLIAVALWSVGLIPGAVALAWTGAFALAAILMLLGVAGIAGFVVLYRRFKARQEREREEEMRRWAGRFGELRARMDRFLEDL